MLELQCQAKKDNKNSSEFLYNKMVTLQNKGESLFRKMEGRTHFLS